MTARYNIFKDTTPLTEPAVNKLSVKIAQSPQEDRLRLLPNDKDRYHHAVDNLSNVRRGHDVSGDHKDGD